MRIGGRAVLVAIVGVVSMVGVACSLLTSVDGLSDGAPADGGAGQGSDGEAGVAETSTPGDAIGAAFVKGPQTGWRVRTDNVLFDAK